MQPCCGRSTEGLEFELAAAAAGSFGPLGLALGRYLGLKALNFLKNCVFYLRLAGGEAAAG
ncbi:hypothetical protein SGRA_0440 [Saprospira grandis str. Lewin]|uniref:Uncharacterized protein n=1 Tax=Saprospira grandis (strain Lewin) TaxID=984262 RepID=H6L943_SAPGL|nr:hypothetical protein SGRA_0440 [Saprospira grandis str. Lewin]